MRYRSPGAALGAALTTFVAAALLATPGQGGACSPVVESETLTLELASVSRDGQPVADLDAYEGWDVSIGGPLGQVLVATRGAESFTMFLR